MTAYVHGYGAREADRLLDQARTLSELLHAGTRYPPGSAVLEVGCGVGAQTVILAERSPGARFTAVDVSAASLAEARRRLDAAGVGARVRLEQADLFALPYRPGSFDHAFVCFVLEHLPDPLRALDRVRAQLAPGGTITVIEGDHGSALFHPDGAAARRTIACLVELQARAGGDALVGRRLQPLLSAAGFSSVAVSPRTVYADATRPGWAKGFTELTFTAMVEGVRDEALARGLVDVATWRAGIAELRRAASPGGVFCYTFFKATAAR